MSLFAYVLGLESLVKSEQSFDTYLISRHRCIFD